MNKTNISHGVRQSNTEKPKKELGFDVAFWALNILAVPFSAIATFNGYKESTAVFFMAVILASMTGVLFLALNFIIMERRKKGEPHLKQVLGYIFPLAISFFGNFTFFYGNTIQASSIKIELAKYSQTFDDTYHSAISILNDSAGIPEVNAKVLDMKNQLKAQSDPSLGWWGIKADAEWNKINAHFKNELGTDLTPISTKNKKKKYSEAETIIDLALQSIVQTKTIDLNRTTDPINSIYTPLHKLSDSLKKDENKKALKSSGEDLINNIKAANDIIISKTKFIAPSFFGKPLNPFISSSASNPIQALEHAWKHKTKSIAPAQSMFFSLIIDLVTLGFIFLAFSYNKTTRRKKNIARTL